MTSHEADPDAVRERLSRRYLDALLAADRHGVDAVVKDGLDRGLTPPALLLEVMTPALREVGERWHRGEVSVAEEHWATQVTLDEMERVRLSRPAHRTLELQAVVAVAPEETHVMPARVVATLLEWRGWRVDFLGGGLPPEDLITFAARRRPDLVALSVTLPAHLPAVREAVTGLRALDPRPRILVGGAAFREEAAGEGEPPEADWVVTDALEGIVTAEEHLGVAGTHSDPATYLARLGERIRASRGRLGLSQGDLAERASLTRPYLSAVERGKQNITLEALLRIAGALELPLDELLRPGG